MNPCSMDQQALSPDDCAGEVVETESTMTNIKKLFQKYSLYKDSSWLNGGNDAQESIGELIRDIHYLESRNNSFGSEKLKNSDETNKNFESLFDLSEIVAQQESMLEPIADVSSVSESYFFLSYTHNDSKVVKDDTSLIRSSNCEIWLDRQIHPGLEWRVEIAEAISNAKGVFTYISPAFLSSSHCIQELNFALDEEKPIVLIYLEEIEIPKWMRLALCSKQAIFRHLLTNKEYVTQIQNAVKALEYSELESERAQIEHK